KDNNSFPNNTIIYTFDTTKQRWDIPLISGSGPQNRQQMDVVSTSDGEMYIFGGLNVPGFNMSYNDMYMFDSMKFSWSSALGTSISRYSYTATLLPNSNIVYIGGRSTPPIQLVDINQVHNFKYYSFHNFVIYEIIYFKYHSRFQSLIQ